MKGMRVALGALLAFSLMPMPVGAAWADKPAASNGAAAQVALEPGTYVEHEAIAYVIDDGIQLFSAGSSVLDNAENLMSVDADAAAKALGEDAEVRALSASDDSAAAAGRLVLVRDESKTTEELIAELEADPRVVFAEPNGMIETEDADDVDGATDDASSADEEATGLNEDESNTPVEGDGSNETDGADGASDKGNKNSNEAVAGAEDDGILAMATDVEFGEDKDEPANDLNQFVWGFDNDGRMGGIPADEAVDMGYNGWPDKSAAASLDTVVVAVVDSGVDASNPDLAPVMWDDGLTTDGLATTGKEDKYGFAYGGGEGTGITSTTGIKSYHGTHVAGTIGAAWDGEGISGLAGNVEIMAVRHSDTFASMLGCFDYVCRARDAGVDVRVTNNSWGFGQGSWRSLDIALTQLGQKGVVSVFASGNSTYDNDTAANPALVYADNPYVVEVNALDPTGDIALYSQYGETTTDVMAPGSTVLSTFATGKANADGVNLGPIYLGEEDDDAVLYESFDSATHACADVADESGDPTMPNDQTQMLSFYSDDKGTIPVGEVSTSSKSFDSQEAYVFRYDPAEISGEKPTMRVYSNALDLSGVNEKPTHLSIRYAIEGGDVSTAALARVYVRATGTEDGWAQLEEQGGSSFGVGSGSWHGLSAALPENVDWGNFQIRIDCRISEASSPDGVLTGGDAVAGDFLLDSIGLGSDLVPYAYMQGTSMACPAVAGAAAVIAGQGLANVKDDPAKSAEKLAALVKAAAEPDDRYEGFCSTSGHATVDNASNPNEFGPAITEVEDADDAVIVRGYFMPQGVTTVKLGDATAEVSRYADLGDGKAELTVRKPEGFAGGQVIVEAQANGKVSKQRANLGELADVKYYDQANLPIPDELNMWGEWQLVGFNGDIYCLPRTSTINLETVTGQEPEPCDHILRYDPDTQEWKQIYLPDELPVYVIPDGAGGTITRYLVDISGATLDGALVLQLNYAPNLVGYVRYTADGEWEDVGFAYVPIESDMPIFGTLASDGKDLYVFGGLLDPFTSDVKNSANVYRVDLDNDPQTSLEKCGELSKGRIRPQVSYGNGAFMVSSGESIDTQFGGVSGAEVVTYAQGGYDYDKGEEISAGWKGSPVDTTSVASETKQLAYASGAIADGFMLVGPQNYEGAADTYVVETADGVSIPTEYGKRASHQMLVDPAATAYRGRLYVLAATQNEPYRVFSSTAVETVEQAGDVPLSPDPDPDPDPEPEPGSDPTPDPQPSPNPKPTNYNNVGTTAKPLATTGDSLTVVVPILAGVGVLALIVTVLAVARRHVR